MPVMKLERILTYFHQKPWLLTKEKSVSALKKEAKSDNSHML